MCCRLIPYYAAVTNVLTELGILAVYALTLIGPVVAALNANLLRCFASESVELDVVNNYTDVIERVKISIVCREMFVEPTIKVIMDVAHTGKVGDGRIFLSDMIDCYSIRTGDHGDTVLADKK